MDESPEAYLNEQIKYVNSNLISDGYHTFGDLYDHRNMLFLTLCRALRTHAWRSKRNSENEDQGDWFLLGLFSKEGLSITYHLPMKMWDFCKNIPIHATAPTWDGHTAEDVLERLINLNFGD